MFLVNDDLALRSFADGTFTGEPEYELVFISKTIGAVLASLYTHFPDRLWYETLLYGTNFLAFFMLASEGKRSPLHKLAWITLSSTVFVWLIQSPTFTTTALVSSGIAASLLTTRVFARTSFFGILTALGLLGLGLAWRQQSIIPTLLVVIAIALSFALASGVRKRQRAQTRFLSSLGSVFILFAIPVVTLDVVDKSCWSQTVLECEEWEAFRQHTEIRGSFHDTPRGSQIPESAVFEKWGETGEEQFFAWMYFDSDIHGLEALQKLDSVTGNPVLPAVSFDERGLLPALYDVMFDSISRALTLPSVGLLFIVWIIVWILPLGLVQMTPRYFSRVGVLLAPGFAGIAASNSLKWSEGVVVSMLALSLVSTYVGLSFSSNFARLNVRSLDEKLHRGSANIGS